jgi:PAS domain-containing protein
MHPFAGLDGDRLQPRLARAAAHSARPVPAPASLRRLDPLAAVFLGLHGVTVLASLGGVPWQWAGVGLVLLLGLAGLGGRGPTWMVPVRAGTILAVGVALQATAGGAGGWFVAWPFVLVAVYPLALPGPAGVVVAGLAVQAELELGRRERLGRALLDALSDPAAVLDAQDRIVAVNQAWARSAAGGDPAFGTVGQRHPTLGGPGPFEVTVTPWPTATAPSSPTDPHPRRRADHPTVRRSSMTGPASPCASVWS